MTDASQEGTLEEAIEARLAKLVLPITSAAAAQFIAEAAHDYYRNKGVPIDDLDSGRMVWSPYKEEPQSDYYVIVPDAPATGEAS